MSGPDSLLDQLIVDIGRKIEHIGQDLQRNRYEGLAVKMEQLKELRDAAFSAEG